MTKMVLRKKAPPTEWADVRFGNLDDIVALYRYKRGRNEWLEFEDGEQAAEVSGSFAAYQELMQMLDDVDSGRA